MILARQCIRGSALRFLTTRARGPNGREPSVRMSSTVSFLGQTQAQQLDVDLMSPQLGFSIYQLMELAGLSCASAIRSEYPDSTHREVIVLCGPGNNGGDGLVCARHLHHFGYSVAVTYPKFRAENELYAGLVTQLKSLGVQFVEVDEAIRAIPNVNVVVDAMFGFSFTGVPREPFSALIQATVDAIRDSARDNQKSFAVAAIDVPSGFHVEDGDVNGLYGSFHPHMLISLTAPKLCAKTFKGGVHYLGGRFVPPAIVEKYNLRLPRYEGAAQCVKISGGREDETAARSVENIRKTYDSTVETSLFDGQHSDPIALFQNWFDDAKASDIEEPNAMAVTSVSATGQPSTRFVLLRGVDREGFSFFTNYNSRKGSEFAANPKCSATFFWERFSRSVRIEGTVVKLDASVSDAYWDSRPRSHQLGALSSQQSETIGGDAELLARYEELERTYQGRPIPRPDFWGGYVIKPNRIEFWQGRSSRLHERLEYSRSSADDSAWRTRRLAP